MNIQLIALDIDGTIEDSIHTIDSELKIFMKIFEESGIIISLISGRLPSGMIDTADNLQLRENRIFSGADGAVSAIYKGLNNYSIKSYSEIDLNSLSSIVTEYPGLLLTNDEVFEIGDLNLTMKHLSKITSPNISRFFSWDDAIIKTENKKVIGLRWLIERNKGYELIEKLQSINQYFDIFDNNEFSTEYIGIALRPENGNKGEILKTISAHYNIPVENTLSMGDWVTDIPMLQRAGYSICPSDALSHVKQSAKKVSKWNMSSGWVKKELKLIIDNNMIC